jgi:UDP-3-O-[3-hydroxymyristoyl] glucosamine N-acyltransferase
MFTGNTISLSELAQGSGVLVLRDCELSYVGKIPSNLPRRFVPCAKPEHISSALAVPDIVGIATTPDLVGQVPEGIGLITCDDPLTTCLRLHETLYDMDGFQWKHFDTKIHPTAKIHPSAIVAEQDVIIGPGSIVSPGSVIMERTIIGRNCNVGVGVLVGIEAFEIFEKAEPRRILKQAGGVMLEDGVAVLANCTVVRATFGGFTLLKKGCMIDGLVHIAHDVVLGENTTVAACAELSGRCEFGDGVYVGPNACTRNGIKVGKNARISMGAVVTRDVPEGEVVSGNFAVAHATWLNFIKSLGQSKG